MNQFIEQERSPENNLLHAKSDKSAKGEQFQFQNTHRQLPNWQSNSAPVGWTPERDGGEEVKENVEEEEHADDGEGNGNNWL